jgi:hypothetical protein
MLGSLGNGGEFRLHLVLELARIDEKSIPGDEGLARLRIPNDVTGSSKRRRILNLNRSCKYSLSKPEQIELRNLKKFTRTRLRRRPRRNLRRRPRRNLRGLLWSLRTIRRISGTTVTKTNSTNTSNQTRRRRCGLNFFHRVDTSSSAWHLQNESKNFCRFFM